MGVRGTYEFIPGTAAGPYRSDDPWLVLRAELERQPLQFHVGANSAAWLLGYAQRSPTPHIVVAETGTWIPRPLRRIYRVLTTSPAPAHGEAYGLPVPASPELFVEVAQLAPRLRLDAAAGWLRRLLSDANVEEVVRLLRNRSITTRARAGYLADVSGASEHAAAIERLGPLDSGPFYTGPARADAAFSARWRVYDTGRIAGSSVTR